MDNNINQVTPQINETPSIPSTNPASTNTPIPPDNPFQNNKSKKRLIVIAVFLLLLPVIVFGLLKLSKLFKSKFLLLEEMKLLTLTGQNTGFNITTDIPICTEVNSLNGKGAINMLDIKQNKILWSIKTNGASYIETLDDKYAVAIGYNSSDNFALFDVQNGNILWTKKITTTGPNDVSTKLFGNILIINAEDSPNLQAVDITAGNDLWSYPKGNSKSNLFL